MTVGFALSSAWLPPRSRRALDPGAGRCRGKRRRAGVCALSSQSAASGGSDDASPGAENRAPDGGGVPEAERSSRAFVEYMKEASATESALANPTGSIPSHKLITFDGLEPARFVYVVRGEHGTWSLFSLPAISNWSFVNIWSVLLCVCWYLALVFWAAGRTRLYRLHTLCDDGARHVFHGGREWPSACVQSNWRLGACHRGSCTLGGLVLEGVLFSSWLNSV